MGTKERQDRERQAVTASILTAARDLFIAEGYQSVSIRKIAERIEYSPAAIYSYFASKDDIFLTLAEEGFHRLDARVRDAMKTGNWWPAQKNDRSGIWWQITLPAEKISASTKSMQISQLLRLFDCSRKWNLPNGSLV